MDDRDKKIVTLTHELVRSNMILGGAQSGASRNSITFKTLCFAAMLAAAGGGGVTAMNAEFSRPINRFERTEINALIFFASREKKLDEKMLLNDIRALCNIENLDDMTERDFLRARRYLQDRAQ